jgi:hypothetical protein
MTGWTIHRLHLVVGLCVLCLSVLGSAGVTLCVWDSHGSHKDDVATVWVDGRRLGFVDVNPGGTNQHRWDLGILSTTAQATGKPMVTKTKVEAACSRCTVPPRSDLPARSPCSRTSTWRCVSHDTGASAVQHLRYVSSAIANQWDSKANPDRDSNVIHSAQDARRAAAAWQVARRTESRCGQPSTPEGA